MLSCRITAVPIAHVDESLLVREECLVLSRQAHEALPA